MGSLIAGRIFSMLLFYVLISWLISSLINSPEFIKHKTNLFVGLFTLFTLISFTVIDVHQYALDIFSEYIKCLLIYFKFLAAISISPCRTFQLQVFSTPQACDNSTFSTTPSLEILCDNRQLWLSSSQIVCLAHSLLYWSLKRKKKPNPK